MRRILVALALLPFLASTAMADFVGSGSGFNWPDNDPAGVSSSIIVALAPNEIISDVEVTLQGTTHSWIGDLNATLTGPGGSIDVFFRTGDAQGDCCGDSSDILGDYTFSDDGGDWWAAAAAAGGADVIPNGDYQPTGATGVINSFAGTFGGSTTNGTWTLSISDNAGGDTGGFQGWELRITSTPIPEPATLGLLGLAGVGLVLSRRRRK